MSDTQQAEVVDEGSIAPDTIEVSALLSHDLNHVWHVLSTNDGVAAVLGDGATLGNKGEHWRATDGTHGVWRSYHPLEQVRLSWHASEDGPRSLVDLHLAPHEHVEGDLDSLKARWAAALSRLEAAAAG